MARNKSQKHKDLRKTPKLTWKIVGRVSGGLVELVQIPIKSGSSNEMKESIIQVVGKNRRQDLVRKKKSERAVTCEKKKGKAKDAPSPRQGMLSDRTGAVALRAFQKAVREAKRR